MRDEILKRLDELMEGDSRLPKGRPWQLRMKKWKQLRAELAAERCENCLYWGDNHRCLCATVQHQLGRLGCEMPFTSATFGCMCFWAKKEPT